MQKRASTLEQIGKVEAIISEHLAKMETQIKSDPTPRANPFDMNPEQEGKLFTADIT